MNKEGSLKKMIVAAFLIALSIVLTRMLSITTPFFRIGFGSVPIMIAGIVLGPQTGFLVGAVADLVGFVVSPTGSFMPGFTLTSALTGAIPGILWKVTATRKQPWGAQTDLGSGGAFCCRDQRFIAPSRLFALGKRPIDGGRCGNSLVASCDYGSRFCFASGVYPCSHEESETGVQHGAVAAGCSGYQYHLLSRLEYLMVKHPVWKGIFSGFAG